MNTLNNPPHQSSAARRAMSKIKRRLIRTVIRWADVLGFTGLSWKLVGYLLHKEATDWKEKP